MNYQEMKASHDLQIEALLAEDYKGLVDILYPDNLSVWKNHQDVWSSTGMVSYGLFGSLPGCTKCLTQIKDRMNEQKDFAEVTPEMMEWGNKFGLLRNHLIPQWIEDNTVLTREQLEEFSRLQLLANFPEGAPT